MFYFLLVFYFLNHVTLHGGLLRIGVFHKPEWIEIPSFIASAR